MKNYLGYMKRNLIAGLLSGILMMALTGMASATSIINNSTMGYYNSSIGLSLDKTNPVGNTFMFPGTNYSVPYGSTGYTGGDPTLNILSAPNLSTASKLGNWLTDPSNLNKDSNWSFMSIPSSWKVNDETAVVYKIDAGTTGLKNVLAQFGVDNGIFAWLDGSFLHGWLAPGGVGAYEYTQNIGSLSAGNHYLQILREDHGGSDGYVVNVTGDAAPVPEPGTMVLLGFGMFCLAVYGKRRINYSLA